jgi:hypothetical protein
MLPVCVCATEECGVMRRMMHTLTRRKIRENGRLIFASTVINLLCGHPDMRQSGHSAGAIRDIDR